MKYPRTVPPVTKLIIMSHKSAGRFGGGAPFTLESKMHIRSQLDVSEVIKSQTVVWECLQTKVLAENFIK